MPSPQKSTPTPRLTLKTVTVSEEEFAAHCEAHDGICLSCEEWTTGGVEPDACKYPCESCDADAVYGAEEAMIMGNVDFTPETES